MLKRLAVVWLLILVLAITQFPIIRAQVSNPAISPERLASADNFVRAPRLGITFISSPDEPISEERYRQALVLGAGWNRWPLYWDRVESASGNFDWQVYDQLVREDLRHNLQINAILLGIPEFYRDSGSIAGLFAPIFSDGSDIPGVGKHINPQNPWANFVFEAVFRYKPGGFLAQRDGWPAGQGVTVWEAWNEPDFELFWQGGVENYARLLKVAYIAAHWADPDTTVMFGGLAYNTANGEDWLAQVLDIYARDPQRAAQNWYMDQVALHSYSYARRSALLVRDARSTLARYGLERPIWLNETGVPIWDDYPGPTWTGATPNERVLRATAEQQAAFLVQSAAYAWAEGADVVFFHQLYDDCGNQSFGADFPPHNGELCAAGAVCWGDAHGLYRNESDSVCFSQHDLPGTPRPAASAYRLLAQVFGDGNFSGGSVQQVEPNGLIVSFDRPQSGERIHVIWNQSLEFATVGLPADSQNAGLFAINNQGWVIAPEEGAYVIGLPPATRDDYPFLLNGDVAGIGGPPLILVENPAGGLTDFSANPALLQFSVPLTAVDAQPPLSPVIEAQTALPRPTVDPAFDNTPPTAAMLSLPVVSAPSFTLHWSGQDDSGIETYLVWVRENDGEWQPWLETAETQAAFTGVSGTTYEFAVWAVDLAGNWSRNVDLSPQAATHVE